MSPIWLIALDIYYANAAVTLTPCTLFMLLLYLIQVIEMLMRTKYIYIYNSY